MALADRVYKAASPIAGFGCFARIPFATGEHIGTFEGRRVRADGPHVLWVYDPVSSDAVAREGTNLLRWMNHSDEPNAELRAFELFARRPIRPDEEITIDYSGA